MQTPYWQIRLGDEVLGLAPTLEAARAAMPEVERRRFHEGKLCPPWREYRFAQVEWHHTVLRMYDEDKQPPVYGNEVLQ